MVKKRLRVTVGLLFGAGLLAISAVDSTATYVPFYTNYNQFRKYL